MTHRVVHDRLFTPAVHELELAAIVQILSDIRDYMGVPPHCYFEQIDNVKGRITYMELREGQQVSASVAFVFPEYGKLLDPQGNVLNENAPTGVYEVLVFYWMPENGIKKRELRDGMPYRTWADQGFIELCFNDSIVHTDCSK